MSSRIAIVQGRRTPFASAFGPLAHLDAVQLGCYALREVLQLAPDLRPRIDEVIAGNVAQPGDAANIAGVSLL